MHGSRWRGLETEHRLDKDAEVAHPTGKPTERRLRVLQPERATAPVPDPTREAAPRTAEAGYVAMIDSILAALTRGPAVMIDRPPPPAAPKSDHHGDRPCHSEVAGQTVVCVFGAGPDQGSRPRNSAQVSKS